MLCIFWEQIKAPVIIIKRWLIIFPPCSGHFDHHHHWAVFKLIDVTVIGAIHTAQNIDCIRIHGNANRKQVIKVICNVRSVDDKLPLVASRMHHGRDPLKSRNLYQQSVRKRPVFVAVNTVLDDVKAVFVLPMDLQVQVILSCPRDHAVERAFCNNPVLPSQRENMLDRHIV